MVRIGLLDQSIIYEGETAASTLEQTVSYAQAADQLGFDAFYVSEHHLVPELAGVSPEVLMGYLLAATSTIRIGSAGVMLQHFIPYKVAENFAVLTQLAPDRVIAGIGKAQGGNDQVVKVLQKDAYQQTYSFDEKYQEFVGLLRHDLPEHHRYHTLTLQPRLAKAPDVMLLGGSLDSVNLAHQTNTGLIYPYFANGNIDTFETIKTAFENKQAKPFVAAMTVALVSDEYEKAAYLEQLASYTVHFSSGKRLNFADEASAKAYQEQQAERTTLEKKTTGAFVGTKQELMQYLVPFIERYQLEEIIVHTPYQPYAKKMALIQFLSEIFALKPKGVFA